MADFAAVIRRAVDGLAENTPEMRVKVYEKARGAVRRQLESMKPRPPEDMLLSQLDKLEQAIADVENEHAEALPPVEDEAEELVWQDEPARETPPQDETAQKDTGGEADADADAEEEAAAEEESAPDEADEEPLPEAVSEPASAEDDTSVEPRNEPWDEPVETPVETGAVEESDEEQSSTGIGPDDRQIGMWQEPLPEEVSETVADGEPETVYADAPEMDPEVGAEPADDAGDAGRAPWEIAHEAAQDGPVADEAWDEPEPLMEDAPAAQEPAPEEPEAVSVDYDPLLDSLNEARPEGDPVSAHFETETLTGAPSLETALDDHARDEAPSLDWSAAPEPVADEPPAIELPATEPAAAKADDAREEPLQPPPMPPALDLLDWDESMFDPGPGLKSAASSEAPVFDREAKAEPVISEPPAGEAGPAKDGWSDFGDLLASTPKPEPEHAANEETLASATLGGAAASAPISYRTEPKRRNVKGLVIGLIAVALLGGAGYAGWLYRDTLSEYAANLTTTGPAEPQTAQTPTTGEDAGASGEGAGNTTPVTGTQTASTDGAQPAINKFTQRLLADGGEEDAGPAQVAGEPAAGEGKSVAEQNVASNNATPPAAASGEQPGAQAQPGATPEAQPAQQQPAVAGQGGKMFLYEERIGQSVPTAIAGNAVWSLQEEAGDNGKPEPVVQAQINVPERGLSALVTFKRNSDPSLPASHLVEIVFSLPANFEGGAIESVQRIAMKTTEQDRGNALIAVPAKITDDFHMIALNDFPEARATNLELLRTRDWIDIPVTYRNGRRALLTLEKGQAGADAFNKAIQAWNALGTANEP